MHIGTLWQGGGAPIYLHVENLAISVIFLIDMYWADTWLPGEIPKDLNIFNDRFKG